MASVVGQQYYNYILNKYSAPRPGQTADEFALFRQEVTKRVDYLVGVSTLTSGWLRESGGAPMVSVRISDINFKLINFLEFFADPQMASLYADLERREALHPLCQKKDQNPATGYLVCSREFLQHTMRDESYCPDGVFIAPLPRLCDETAGMTCESGSAR